MKLKFSSKIDFFFQTSKFLSQLEIFQRSIFWKKIYIFVKIQVFVAKPNLYEKPL